MSDEAISIYNQDGTIKSKEEFLQDVENIYNSIVSESIYDSDNIENIITDPEVNLDEEQIISNFNYLSRSLYITGEITQEISNRIFQMINLWNEIDSSNDIKDEERNPIKIYINTPGGDLDATFSIIGAIKASKTPIHTITIGQAYSGGFLIQISGDKKFCYPYSAFLFHEGSSFDCGDAHKFIQHTEFYKTQLSIMKDLILSNTKISESEYECHHKDDWFITSKEAVEKGIVDIILE